MNADDFVEPTDEGAEDVPPEEEDTPAEPSRTVQPPRSRATESFFDPSRIDELDVPDETKAQLRATWKQMHGGYTKRLQALKGTQEAADLVQRFNTDPAFAQEVILTRAKQLGITLGTPEPKAASTNGTSEVRVPAEMVETMRGELPAEMQWMAPILAKAFVMGSQQASQPTEQRVAQLEAERRTERETQNSAAWEAAEAEMDEKYPLWRDSEDDLLAMTQFITSDRLTHPKFGNKIELIYKVLHGQTIATGEVARRMTQAGRNRVSTGTTARVNTAEQIQERIKKAPNMQQKWQIAAQAAREQLGL